MISRSQANKLASTTGASGLNCVITGGTSGIGKVTVEALAEMNANVVFVGRNEREGVRLAARLRRRSPEGRLEFVRADLARQSEVRALAETVRLFFDRIDVLINNAGARNDWYTETPDGIETTFAVNHLAHFLLTSLLMDRLLEAPQARVITVSSGAHAAAADGNWQLDRGNYNRRLAYAQSKLANVLFAYELARRLAGTGATSNSVDPGGVATNFARNNGAVRWVRHLVAHALKGDLVSPRKGAQTLIYLAVSPAAAGVSGKHFRLNTPVASSPQSYDRDAALGLWALSERLTRLEHPGLTSGPILQRQMAPIVS
jgi:NAD(P)-dependent dehydrogenase (short-subunit alcohol dehydrogenase family)